MSYLAYLIFKKNSDEISTVRRYRADSINILTIQNRYFVPTATALLDDKRKDWEIDMATEVYRD